MAIIGHDILDNLMGGVDPIGKEIRVDGQHVQRDRRREAGRKDARPEPRQLGDDADHDLASSNTARTTAYASGAKAYGVGAPLETGDRPGSRGHALATA